MRDWPKGDLSLRQLPGCQAYRSGHGAIDQSVCNKEGGKVYLHYIHDAGIEIPGAFFKPQSTILIPVKEFEGGQTPDTFQIIASELFQAFPVSRFQRLDVLAEKVVYRHQHHRSGQQQHSREKGDLPQPEKQINWGGKAVDQSRKILAVIDLHGFHSIHGGGDGGGRADHFDIAHIQLKYFGEDGSAQ